MLKKGWAFPYFIWPNVVPFFYPGRSISDSIPDADGLQDWISSSRADQLNEARSFVREARNDKKGVFSENTLSPFELRFLSRRSPPNRCVLDLGTCSNQLIKPVEYYKIEAFEDRLFIDEHYVDLFLKKGYTL